MRCVYGFSYILPHENVAAVQVKNKRTTSLGICEMVCVQPVLDGIQSNAILLAFYIQGLVILSSMIPQISRKGMTLPFESDLSITVM